MDENEKPSATPGGAHMELDDLDSATYLRIKRIASRFVRHRLNPTLNATAVANEIWIRLKKSKSPLPLRDPVHFDALVGQTASYVAGDSARRRLSQKRQGIRATDVDLNHQAARQASLDTIVQMTRAMAELEANDPKAAAILRDFYFEGLTVAEISTNREIPRRTVERALTLGRAWIHDRLTREPDDPHEPE